MEIPDKLKLRPLVNNQPYPYFWGIDEQGKATFQVNNAAWKECVLKNKCGYCGLPSAYWIYFVVPEAQVHLRLFDHPPLHKECAQYLAYFIKDVQKNAGAWTLYRTRRFQVKVFSTPNPGGEPTQHVKIFAAPAAEITEIKPETPKAP